MDPITLKPRDIGDPTTLPSSEHVPNTTMHEAPRKNENFIVEVFKFSMLALIIVVPFRFFVAQPFIVSGASMSPTFKTGEYLIVDQITYRLEQPERGDVIVFRYPNDPSKYFIKRIIGLPGEVVELANGVTSITNPEHSATIALQEPYLVTDRTNDHLAITLSSDEYFVMGDNRGASSDSRVWGPVPRKDIIGRAFLRLLPPNTFGIFPGASVETLSTKTDTN
ncbi:MAG: signal peptidase I [Candidatus Pacebacteria bacterium]|nr:signal peptidase I [Candidatus Paceibacterota bacterium]